jgi:hypothetical protein
MTLTHEQLQAADRAEERSRERHAVPARDEVQCRCGQWYLRDEAHGCDVCQTVMCPNCLNPAVNPLDGEIMDRVCAVCRENILLMQKQASFWNHRQDIGQSLARAIEDVEILGCTKSDEWPVIIGRIYGRLKMMRAMYGLEE